jgi:hypothetical protein
MLAGVKLIDKAAAEKALRQEERARKEEKKQLKKVRLRIWQSDGMKTSCRMQLSTSSHHLDCNLQEKKAQRKQRRKQGARMQRV